jgi:hypothetical protein
VTCGTCHGAVESRDVLWKQKDISMTACVECHQVRKASIACDTCHDMEH